GVKQIADTWMDMSPLTEGLITSPSVRQQLQDIFLADALYIPPNMPVSQENGVSQYSVKVTQGQPIVIDAEIAHGFQYQVKDGDPLFASFALPDLGDSQGTYGVQVLTDDRWVSFVDALPLREYMFDQPVEAFRVTGIDPAIWNNDDFEQAWATMLTFLGDGTFQGSMAPVSVGPVYG